MSPSFPRGPSDILERIGASISHSLVVKTPVIAMTGQDDSLQFHPVTLDSWNSPFLLFPFSFHMPPGGRNDPEQVPFYRGGDETDGGEEGMVLHPTLGR